MLSARPVAHPRRGEQGPRRGPAREANRQQAVCGLPALPVPKAPASIVLAPKVPEPPARGPAGPLFTGFSSRKTHACQPKAGWEAGPAGPAGFSCRKSLVLAGSQEPARPVGAEEIESSAGGAAAVNLWNKGMQYQTWELRRFTAWPLRGQPSIHGLGT